MSAKRESLFERRKRRNRYNLKQRANGKIRLSVSRSNKHISAQLIDDKQGVTLASATTKSSDSKNATSNVAAAIEVGKAIAAAAKKAKIKNVVFDRGAYLYHGRVKALGDAAREAGLEF